MCPRNSFTFNIRSRFTHLLLDNDVKRTSKRRRIFKLLTKMVLNFFKLFNFIAIFIVKLLYSNHIFLPSCAVTLKIQMVFFSLFYLFMYFMTGGLKSRYRKSDGKTRNGNLHMKT